MGGQGQGIQTPTESCSCQSLSITPKQAGHSAGEGAERSTQWLFVPRGKAIATYFICEEPDTQSISLKFRKLVKLCVK